MTNDQAITLTNYYSVSTETNVTALCACLMITRVLRDLHDEKANDQAPLNGQALTNMEDDCVTLFFTKLQ